MALEQRDIDWVRTYVVWDPPTDGDLSARYDLLFAEMVARPGFVLADYPRDDQLRVRAHVALWYVRARLSAMLDDPSSFSVDGGEYSESWSANIPAMREKQKELEQIAAAGGAGDGAGMTVGHLTRPGGFRC